MERVYIYKQTAGEIIVSISPETESINLFGEQGYQKSQLQAINELLAQKDLEIILECNFAATQNESELIYNLDVITYLSNLKELLVTNLQGSEKITSIDFVKYTPLLHSFSVLGLIAKSIPLDVLLQLKHLRSLSFREYLGITKKQSEIINHLLLLEKLDVKELDAALLIPNPNMKQLYVHTKLINSECLPDKFPNLEKLFLKRKGFNFSFVSHLLHLKELCLYWIFELETLPNLSKQSNLEILDICGCPNLQYGIEQVSNLLELKAFRASELTKLKAEDFEPLSRLHKLKYVHIHFRDNNLENGIIEEMEKKYNWDAKFIKLDA